MYPGVVLVPLYLLHRNQAEAVIKSVGGVYHSAALKRDRGCAPSRRVDRRTQLASARAVLGLLDVSELELASETRRWLMGAPPDGYREEATTRELFASYAPPLFDELVAAELLAQHVLGNLLDPRRVARVVQQSVHAIRRGLTSLAAVHVIVD